jgi:long-chain acyl-CoA synthetase
MTLMDTLPALFQTQADRFGRRVAIRFKRHGLYHDLRWDEYREQVSACAAALVQHGILPGDRVAILAENRLEWLVADMAILCVGAVNVPLHAPLIARQAHWQLDNAGAKWIFVSNVSQYEKVRHVRAELPELRGIVSFDEHFADDVIGWPAFLQRGRIARSGLNAELARREAHLLPDDLATIIYTSGTTGNPKGVMLTQRNLLSNALAFTHVGNFGLHTVSLSWLPYSHIYARTVDIYVTLAVGATLCLAENAETVVANLGEIQPTNLSSVPRLYEKVLTAVQDADSAVVGKRLRAIFGPNIDFLASGGAPLSFAVAQAYENAGFLLLQGYGLTESSPVISFNHRDCHKIESVGKPIPGVEVRIGADGEVLSRGPHIMKGYWRNPQETADAIQDGWLHTGDLGRIDEDGFLHITGRKKELLVLSNGKKVVPPHVEGILLADPCIDQVVVTGEGRNYLVALVVPHFTNLTQALGLPASSSPESLVHDPTVRAFLEARIQQALTDVVSSCEQVKKIVVLPEPFSVAKDELTVSLKLRRTVILEHYRAELDARYRE